MIEVGGMRLPVGVEFVKKDLWEFEYFSKFANVFEQAVVLCIF
ncbi:MAG: hypothetical protein WAT89_04320 [Candidatus Kapaibacterium sp.]